MTRKIKDKLPLDAVARDLAADAGEVWNKMAEFPGYHRTIWRDEARIEVRKVDPEARIECQPPTWDGREGMCFIRRPEKD